MIYLYLDNKTSYHIVTRGCEFIDIFTHNANCGEFLTNIYQKSTSSISSHAINKFYFF